MTLERKFYAFKAKNPPKPPMFEEDPEWKRAFAEFVDQTSRLGAADLLRPERGEVETEVDWSVPGVGRATRGTDENPDR
jgi:hypothetical protein